ncbi:MAG TPA: type II toxin-antitoxin system RelE/ParE family toxin, partial [Longimicrobium sp.]|nr:type II toxin-antitoxin system RelE/ParE family toxin [Longimicrobium sp.]
HGGPGAALAFAELLEATCDRLAAFPESGATVTDINVRGLRRFQMATYTIYYRPMAFGIQVSRILHQSRGDHGDEFKKRRKSA